MSACPGRAIGSRPRLPFHYGRSIPRNFPSIADRGTLRSMETKITPLWPSPLEIPPPGASERPEHSFQDSSLSTQMEDTFSHLDDRQDAPPLPLPSLPGQQRRMVLVRHGQSTWNAMNRIQGSSDLSVLTEKGMEQASAAHLALKGFEFNALFASPLQRAAHTAQVVWGDRKAPAATLPSLREIDLYGFQGLDKAKGPMLHPERYGIWKARPHEFEIDGHIPVRELWYRSSLAWKEMLTSPFLDGGAAPSALVVAHNAVNQALICTALGLFPEYFRRLTQTNASYSILNFEWDLSGEACITVQHLNYVTDGYHIRKCIRAASESVGSQAGKTGIGHLLLIARESNDTKAMRTLQSLQIAEESIVRAAGGLIDQVTGVERSIRTGLLDKDVHGNKMVVAITSPLAIQGLLERCLRTDGIGKGFVVDDGSVSVINYSHTADDISDGVVLCVNQTL